MNSGAYVFFDQYRSAKGPKSRGRWAVGGGFNSFFDGSGWSFERIIVAQMTSSIGLCLGAVVVISAVVLAHPLSVFVVLIALALVFMDLMGRALRRRT